MASKKVMGQVHKAVQLILKEHWNFDSAVEAAFTSVSDEFCLEEFQELVSEELGE